LGGALLESAGAGEFRIPFDRLRARSARSSHKAMVTIQDITEELKQVIDPELPLNIVDLGLIYDVQLEGRDCRIEMTLTSRDCPMADSIPEVVGRVVSKMPGVESVEVEVVWEPVWSVALISPEGRAILAKATDSQSGEES